MHSSNLGLFLTDIPKPSLKIGTVNDICWNSLGLFRDYTHLSTAVAWREKKFQHFVFNKYFCLVLGELKSKISKKFGEGFLRKLDFKLFHYKAMVQPVSKNWNASTEEGGA